METIFTELGAGAIVFAALIAFVAGFVKGTVGFALPMIMISGISAFLPPEIALAALIVPTMLANLWQALRGGLSAALMSIRRFWVYITIVLLMIILSAQMVSVLPASVMFLILGGPVTLFALAQLLGWQFSVRPEMRLRTEMILATFAGLMGGISGIWGPPTVAYLTAINAPKAEQLRAQGVVYAAGAVVLLGAHLQSGVLSARTLPLSMGMVAPVMAGMVLGLWVHDRLDQSKFRRATLIILVLAGLNLIRRGFFG